MHAAARVGESGEILPERDDVVGEPSRLVAGVQAAGQPPALGRHAGGAMAGVASLRLDAAYRQHGLPGHGHHVCPEAEGEKGGVREAELPRADPDRSVVRTPLGEGPVDPAEPDFEGERDVVGKDERRGARAPFPSVDLDEVDAPVLRDHAIGELDPEAQFAHCRFDAHRQAGPVGNTLDDVQHLVYAAERGMTRRADDRPSFRDTADRRDLRRDLRGGKHAAEAGLGSLAELELDGAHRMLLHHGRQALEVESAALVACAEVPRAELPDEVAAVQVMRCDAALSRVVQASRQRRAAVQRLHGGPGKRSEAHPADADHRLGPERVSPAPSAAQDLGARHRVVEEQRLLIRSREGVVLDDEIVGHELGIPVRAEARVVVLLLGGRIDPPAGVPGERPLLVVRGDDVLPQLGADRLEDVPEVPDDGEVPEDRVALLREVVDDDADQQESYGQEPVQRSLLGGVAHERRRKLGRATAMRTWRGRGEVRRVLAVKRVAAATLPQRTANVMGNCTHTGTF